MLLPFLGVCLLPLLVLFLLLFLQCSCCSDEKERWPILFLLDLFTFLLLLLLLLPLPLPLPLLLLFPLLFPIKFLVLPLLFPIKFQVQLASAIERGEGRGGGACRLLCYTISHTEAFIIRLAGHCLVSSAFPFRVSTGFCLCLLAPFQIFVITPSHDLVKGGRHILTERTESRL